jgi:ferric-dicitrate binding protein FerR (iron transport regulator)
MGETSRISEVITHYLLRPYGGETEANVQRWLIDEAHAEEKNRSLEAFWNTLPEGANRQTYTSLAQVKARLGMGEAPRYAMRRLYIRVAAVLLPLVLLTGSYFLLKNAGTQAGAMVHLSVPYGERRELSLPDASTVTLNAGSSLRYEASFGKAVRRVWLSGEACFAVTRDEGRPFVVETEHLSVEVLGTEFNVKAYPGERLSAATLSSGKIRVETKNRQSYVLTPNRQLSYDSRSEQIQIVNVRAGDYLGWKDGRLIFDNLSLPEILPVLERTFGVRIHTDPAVDVSSRYSVKFVQGENLSEIMNVLETTCGFASRREGETIRLTKN